LESIAVVRGVRWRAVVPALLGCLILACTASSGVALADGPRLEAGASAASVTVRMGDRGPAVKRIQRRLGLSADGVFGSQTKRAVRRFQRRRDMTVDGIVGPQTRRALRLRPFSRESVRSPDRSDGGSSDVPAILRRIAECESGGDPTAVSSSGQYRGKYQFSRETWRRNGGSGDPAAASEAEQDRVALKLYRAEGTDPWPTCGRR
jgi:hypothetical protein